jgi:hypothetical protein
MLCLVVLAAGCGAPADESSLPTLKALTRDQIIQLLAASGVAVVDDVEGSAPVVPVTEPRSPLELTVWQVDHLSLDLKSGGNIAGYQLDELGFASGMPADAPPFSYLVAGWITTYGSEGSKRVLDVMGAQDWVHPDRVIFPHLVLLVFLSDLARDAAAAEAEIARPGLLAGPGGPPRATPIVVDAARVAQCPLTSWVDNIVSGIFNAIKISTDGAGIKGVLAGIWNAAVDLAKKALIALAEVLTAPVRAAIKATVGIVGAMSLMASLLAGFEISATQEGATHWAHPEQSDQVGKFTIKVSSPLGDWPGYLLACARDLGFTLPDVNPGGKNISWEDFSTGDTVAFETSSDATIGSDLTAVFNYQTLREPPLTPPLKTRSANYRVIPRIEMFSDADLEAFTDGLLFGGPAGALLRSVLGGLFDAAYAKIQQFMLQVGDERVKIGWHEEAEPTPTPPPTPTDEPTSKPTSPPTAPPTARPSSPPPPPPCMGSGSKCGRSNGDPHIGTFDDVSYDFMAAGEYVLIRSADGSVEIQVRQEPYPGAAAVTVNTALAARVGEHRVMIDFDPDTDTLRTSVDGELATVSGPIEIGSAGRVVPVLSGYSIELLDGSTVLALGQGDAGINVLVAPSDALYEAGRGLLGRTAPGMMPIPALPDGSYLPEPADDHAAFESLYRTFESAWRVTASSSLFDYTDGRTSEDYFIAGYPSEDDLLSIDGIPRAEWLAALLSCASVSDLTLRDQCAFDTHVTDNSSFAATYQQTELVIASGLVGLPAGVVEILDDIERLGGAALADTGDLYVSFADSNGNPALAAIDTATGATIAQVAVFGAGLGPGPVVVADGMVWAVGVEEADDCSVSRLDPATLAVMLTVPVACQFGFTALTGTDDAVWQYGLGSELTRIDVQTGALSTVPLPFSGGVLSSSRSTVFYSDLGQRYFRLTPGSQAFEQITGLPNPFPAGDGSWQQVGSAAQFFTIGAQPSRSVPIGELDDLVGADEQALYLESHDEPDDVLSRVPLDGGVLTELLRVHDVQTPSGQVQLGYGSDENTPLLIGRNDLVQLWLIPSPEAAGQQVLVMQRAGLP